MKLSQREISHKISSKIREKEPEAEVILYGSRARGNPTGESDWDILVLLDEEAVSLKKEQDIRHHLFDLELEIGQPISVYVHSRTEWKNKYSASPFYSSIEKEGVLLE